MTENEAKLSVGRHAVEVRLQMAAEAHNNLHILFVKYVCHVGAAGGLDFATDVNLSPANMLEQAFTNDELTTLGNVIFPEARKACQKVSDAARL